jgi:signal transduction histidine kinase/ActR/RegA family two-component response regulator
MVVIRSGDSDEAPAWGDRPRGTEADATSSTAERLARGMASNPAMLFAVLEQMPSAVLIAEAPSGHTILTNARVGHIGIPVPPPGAPVHEHDWQLGPRPDGTAQTAADWPLVRAVRLGETVRDEEIAFLRADGAKRVLRASAAPVRDPQGATVAAVMVCDDVTEQRYLQDELLRANKLESLAVLAGGIAHDFNNLLTAILGNVMLARMDLPAGSGLDEALADAERASVRARELTQQLLTFARGGEPVRRVMSLEPLLRNVASLALRGSPAALRLKIAPDLWPAELDEDQLGQVIGNLVTNAREAMPEGGTLTVAAGNEDVIAGDGLPLAAGRYVRIAVSDTGSGISAENLSRIYDPYFSTKEMRSGLGLAVCHTIVDRHGGCIVVESLPGVGSTFSVYLPAAAVAGVVASQVTAPVGDTRVLIMDDEQVVRTVAKRMLQRLGYRAEMAADGAEAIALYRAARDGGDPFDVVLMDLTVPEGMGGREAMARLLTIDPAVVAIVCSGYATDPVLAHFSDYGFRGVVTKPYQMEELGALLARLRQEPPPAAAVQEGA